MVSRLNVKSASEEVMHCCHETRLYSHMLACHSCHGDASNAKARSATKHVYLGSGQDLQSCGPTTEPQKPHNPEKKQTKIQNPPPRIGPLKYEKKKITKCHFCLFFVFSGAHPGWGILYFFVFRDSGVFGVCSRPEGSQAKTPNLRGTWRPVQLKAGNPDRQLDKRPVRRTNGGAEEPLNEL